MQARRQLLVYIYGVLYGVCCAVRQVMRVIDNVRPDRQTVMFSATFPRQMEALARRILTKPVEVQVGGRSVVCKDVEQYVVSSVLALTSSVITYLQQMILTTCNTLPVPHSCRLLSGFSGEHVSSHIEWTVAVVTRQLSNKYVNVYTLSCHQVGLFVVDCVGRQSQVLEVVGAARPVPGTRVDPRVCT